MTGHAQLELVDGARVAVVGGGPAGSFFAYFLHKMAQRVGRDVGIDVYEPRDFSCQGPRGCNMCGGIVSESLMQSLETEGIRLPPTVIQRRINSYFLHMDVGSVRIETPLQEMRIAAVARGGGPRGAPDPQESFDAFLLDLATRQGVRHVPERIAAVRMEDQRPAVQTTAGTTQGYDLLVLAVGVNSPILRTLEGLKSYKPPRLTKAYIAEFPLGVQMIERYLASSMHVFLLNLPRLDFAALIPKSDFVTLCLLGEEIDHDLVDAFLGSHEVMEVLPPHWQIPKDHCHCSPRMNVGTAAQTFGDRIVFIGDCGTTRLFKDGIGAAYRTAKAAARTAIFRGIGERDFRRGFWPACKSIHNDNRLGRVVFALTRQVQKRRYARRALWRMTSGEQKLQGEKRRMSKVLWDTFTGSAPYKTVFQRGLNPALAGRFLWELAAGLRAGETIRPKRQVAFATGETGLTGYRHEQGEMIYRQGDPSRCLYVVHDCDVELVRQDNGAEYRLAVVHRGEFFGEMALFGEEVRPASARVLQTGFIFRLEREGLLRRIHEDPPMAFRLIEHMSRRIAGLENQLIRSGRLTRTAEEWIAERAAVPGKVDAAGDHLLAGEAVGLMGRRFGRDEVIYHQGDRGDCMYVIHGGLVEVVRREAEREVCLTVLGDGDFFGELALFDHEIRPATVRALSDVHVFTLERNALLRRVHEDPSMAIQLIENMASRVADLEAQAIRAVLPGA